MATRVHGTGLVLYFVLLPYVVLSKWSATAGETHGELIRVLLVALTIFWIGFLCHVSRNVWRLRRGRRVNSGASAWVAGLFVALLALVAPTSHATLKDAPAITVVHHAASIPPSRHHLNESLGSLGALPMALMAKRRGDLLRQSDGLDFDVDESIELLRARSPEILAHLASLIGDATEGVVEVRNDDAPSTATPTGTTLVVCALEPSADGSIVGYAREGGRLPVLSSWSANDIANNVVSLNDAKVLFARSEAELLRALATRSLRHSVVLYLGPANELDDELAACTITLQSYGANERDRRHVDRKGIGLSGDLRVELLRADPCVMGLIEPFTATLRRRCIEMTAYLALHRHEPVTGERIRTRVLTYADVDASQRTLANTASAVRRSLGVDELGPRLHPVSSSGLYSTHGITSDVEAFSTLISRARQLALVDATPLVHQALVLIKGEPLASTRRGFEWFLAEGHGARLARDAEWAALALHHTSLERRNYELAFWALQQGQLIDPYSDALSEALGRVPRLREFGGDGRRRAQHQAVGARSAVAMSWSFSGFTQQISK